MAVSSPGNTGPQSARTVLCFMDDDEIDPNYLQRCIPDNETRGYDLWALWAIIKNGFYLTYKYRF